MKNMFFVSVMFLFVMMTLSSCGQKTSTFWVSGYKAPCDMGAGKGQCLEINRSFDPKDGKWEYFYAPIEGFQFEEGVMQQIRVSEEKIDNPPADASSIKYKQIDILNKRKDHLAFLADDQWVLTSWGDGTPLGKTSRTPIIEFHLNNKMVVGNDGCNNINAQIMKVGYSTLSLSPAAVTKKMCPDMEVPDRFDAMLGKVRSYDVMSTTLNLYDGSKRKVAVFSRNMVSLPEKETNPIDISNADPNLQDIWIVTTIEGAKQPRMSNMARLQFNLEDGMAFGNDGCNDYSGPIQDVGESNLQLGVMRGTQKMCRDMETPDSYNKALAKTAGYKVEEDVLTLFDDAGNEVLTFLRARK